MLSHLSCLRDTYDLGIAVNLSCPQFYTFEICTYLHKQYTSLLFHIWKFFFHWPFCILNKHIFIFIDWFLVLKTVVHIICGLLSFFIINDLQEILTFCIISKYLLKAQKKNNLIPVRSLPFISVSEPCDLHIRQIYRSLLLHFHVFPLLSF